jgi:hypothetical protein
MERSYVYRRSEAVVSRQVGREAILVPVHQSVGSLDFIYTLSPVAARIWELLDGNHTVDQIAGLLCDEFDVEPDRAAADVEELLSDLDGVALVSRVA